MTTAINIFNMTGLQLMLWTNGVKQRGRAWLATAAVDMRSRRGIEGAVWNVLTLLAVGAIAVTLLFVLGPTILARATLANQRLQQPPGW